MLVDINQPLYRIVEVKSILKDEFAKLVGPMAEHRLRTALYMKSVAESKSPYAKKVDTTCAHILYVCKGGYIKDSEVGGWGIQDSGYTPFREFIIPRADNTVSKYVEAATALHLFRNEGPIPKGICPHPMHSRAKLCPVRQECFSGKFPEGSLLL